MAEPFLKLSVIVLTWNGADYIRDCLASLAAQEYAGLEVVVVDNGSTDGTPDLVAGQFPKVKLVRLERNQGFAAGNNQGLRTARGDVLVLLNQDTRVHAGFLTSLAQTCQDPAVGIAGCKLLYPDGTIQHAGGYLHGPRGETDHAGRHAADDGRFDQVMDADFVTAAALGIRRPALERIGLLDEGFAPAYYEDVDWCYRARAAGYRVVYQPAAIVTHYESTSTPEVSYWRKFAVNQGRIRFLFKHWPLNRLLTEFAPAEMAWLAAMDRSQELMTARHACLNVLLALPEIVAFRHSPAVEAKALGYLLADLRTAALTSLVSGHAAQESYELLGQEGRLAVDRERAGLIQALRDNQAIHEVPFRSQVPVLGRLIVSIRSLWNSVSTKWYVRPMVQQQSVFNAQVVGYLQVLQDQIQGLQGQIEEQKRLLRGQQRDVAENVRELTSIAERLSGLAAGRGADRQEPD